MVPSHSLIECHEKYIQQSFSMSYQPFVDHVRHSPHHLIQPDCWDQELLPSFLCSSAKASCMVGESTGYLESASTLLFFATRSVLDFQVHI